MGDTLIRGLSEKEKLQIRRLMGGGELSFNQALLQLIHWALKKRAEEAQKEKERQEVFDRIRERREEMRKKYGMMEDSWKLIREDRDSR